MRIFVFILFLLCTGSVQAQIKDPWMALRLSTTNYYGVVVRYSPELAPHIGKVKPVLREVMEKTAAGRENATTLAAERDGILNEINRLTGSDDAKRKTFQNAFDNLLRMGVTPMRFDRPGRPFTLYVVMRERVRAYMKAGGKLPGFTYDEKSGRAQFQAQIGIGQDAGKDDGALTWLPVPVTSVEELDQALEAFRATGQMGKSPAGFLLHQVCELKLRERLASQDPFYRWFTAGFANQLTYHLLQQYVGELEARAYMAKFDTTPHRELEKELNLRFWPSDAYEIITPLESDARLRDARLAYATFEAGRVVQLRGIACVKAVLDEAVKNQPVRSSVLFEAMTKTTGVDMAGRLKQYQPAGTMAEVAALYEKRAKLAATSNKPEEVLTTVLRVMEINPKFDDKVYFHVARLLHEMGHPNEADQVFTRAIYNMKGEHRDLLQRQYVDFLLKMNQPHRALNHSAGVLEKDPTHMPSLSVQMLHALHQKRWLDATNLAEEILKHDPEGKLTYSRNAQKVIAQFKNKLNEQEKSNETPPSKSP